MLFQLLCTAAVLLRSTQAVFVDEAWKTDYHFALLGEPQEETTFFHQPNPASRASLVYTLSEEGVLGAVNPRDGTLVWRQVLGRPEAAHNSSFLRAGEGQDVVISGYDDEVAAWSAGDGKLVWNVKSSSPLRDVEILELSDGKSTTGAKDAISISAGNHPEVQRIDGATGAVKWRYGIEGSDEPYQVSASSTQVFAIVLHKTMLGYTKIRVLALDPVTGKKTDDYSLSSDNELATPDTIISVGANSAFPIIAWTDAAHSTLKVNVIGTKAVHTFDIDTHGEDAVERIRIHAPYHSNSLSHFLVQYESAKSHWAEVYHVNAGAQKDAIKRAYSLSKLAGRGAFSTSTSDANVYFTRITRDEVSVLSSASHGVLGRWPIGSFRVVASANEQIEPVHAVSEASVKGDTVSALRSAVLLSTGDWVLLRNGEAVWNRPELLASTVAATFASPVEVETLVQQLEVEAHSNPVAAYIHRVQRHLADFQRLPAFLQSLPQAFISGFLGTGAESTASDSFGFHQIIACATRNGRIIALDAASPDRVLWNTQIADLKLGQSWQPLVSSPTAGVIEVSSHAGKGVQYSAADGEQVVNTLPIDVEADRAASRAVKYTLSDGSLKATTKSALGWRFVPAEGERIVSLVPRPVNDPVASIGKVLGDRRVLYKYLDPNLALLITARDSGDRADVYVLNTVSGAIIYSTTHTGVDLSSPISSIVSENWFAYSFAAEASDDASKGYQLMVGELFESLSPNDRGPLTGKNNYSSVETGTEPFVLAQTYQIPEPVSKLAVTRTRQGITSRQLLAVLPDSDALVGIPYGVVDPRRPVNRDPTKDEQMEGLVKYSPVIEFDPKWYLNHQREVIGIQDIVTSPALIESTSLLFAYGLDVFGTRLSPSFSFDILGKGFNKFQMLATVAALAVGTFVVAPLVGGIILGFTEQC
jgi:ER membrane protein complex subunit 1